MLQVTHKGIQPSFPIDPALLHSVNGILYGDDYPAGLAELIGGRAIRINANGYVELADGAETGYVGPLVVNATAGFLENKPAYGSGQVAVAFGQCEAVTDQIVPSDTFVPGDNVYVGTGANKGLYTKVAASPSAVVVGIAKTAASAAEPRLTVLFL